MDYASPAVLEQRVQKDRGVNHQQGGAREYDPRVVEVRESLPGLADPDCDEEAQGLGEQQGELRQVHG